MSFEVPHHLDNDPLFGYEQTNGMSDIEEVKKFEDLFCIKRTNPFGTNDIRLFQESLSTMSYASMQELANKVGISPYDNKPLLRDRLIRAFAAESKERQGMMTPPRKQTKQLDPNIPKERALMLELGMSVI